VTPAKNLPLLEGADVVVFSGISDEDLRDRYRKAAILLHPLKECTANNSALEAMACGVPIVVTDIGGIRDYLSDDCALFCRPGDADEMAASVLELLDNSARRSAMGKSARERAESLFAWPIIARKMRGVYEQLNGGV